MHKAGNTKPRMLSEDTNVSKKPRNNTTPTEPIQENGPVPPMGGKKRKEGPQLEDCRTFKVKTYEEMQQQDLHRYARKRKGPGPIPLAPPAATDGLTNAPLDLVKRMRYGPPIADRFRM